MRPETARKPESEIPAPAPRMIGRVNWVGLATLYWKETARFLKVATQTVAAPVITSLLFYAIFALALGGVVRQAGDVPFLHFLAPGLVMMSILQNAFANTSSSLVHSKVHGNIVDELMPPLTPTELLIGYVGGGITRGVLVGAASLTALALVAPLGVHSLFFILFHGVGAAMMLSLLGVIGGIWADKFDHMAAISNFIIAPLSFLSGTFYSIERLPENFQFIANFNPFFYLIDGFRYGFIGQSDGVLAIGVAVVLGVNLALWLIAHRMLVSGYKLKP